MWNWRCALCRWLLKFPYMTTITVGAKYYPSKPIAFIFALDSEAMAEAFHECARKIEASRTDGRAVASGAPDHVGQTPRNP